MNAVFPDGPFEGANLLWTAVVMRQWDLVNRILKKTPNPNINAAPVKAPNQGITVLWYAANYKKWELVKQMLEQSPKPNINAAPTQGECQGQSVFYYAARYKKWDLVRQMLKLPVPHPFLDAGIPMNFPQYQSGIPSERYVPMSFNHSVRNRLIHSGCKDLSILALLYPLRIDHAVHLKDWLAIKKKKELARKWITCFFGSVAREEEGFFARLDPHLKHKLYKETVVRELGEPSLASYPVTNEFLKTQLNRFYADKFTESAEQIAIIGFRKRRLAKDLSPLPKYTKAQIEHIRAILMRTVAQFARQHGLQLNRADRRDIANAISKAPDLSKTAVEHALEVALGKI